MVASQHTWNKKELAYLTKHYGTDMTASQIGDHLGLTHSQVVHRVVTLKLQRRPLKTWTAEQDAFVIKNYGKMRVEDIAAGVDHTFSAIYSRARDLGLQQKRPGYSPANKKIIKTMLKKGHTKYEIAVKIKTTYGSINSMIRKMKKDGEL